MHSRTCTTLHNIAAVCVIAAASGFATAADAAQYDRSYTVSGRPDVRVRVDDSSINVTTSDTDRVEFRVSYQELPPSVLGGKLRIDSRQNGAEVELTVLQTPGLAAGVQSKHIKTEVRMPRNADVRLESENGSVDLASIDGAVVIRATDGAVRASQLAGRIDIQTGDGSIIADVLRGDCRLHSADGDIDATHVDGKLDASSSDGSITASGRLDALDIKSSNGSISAQVVAGSSLTSQWNIRASDGSVNVSLPPDLKAALELSTSNGNITLSLPLSFQGTVDRTQVHGTMNGGGPALNIHTDDGSIHLKGA